jgi:transcriptional regulator with XRE-family HTH domain
MRKIPDIYSQDLFADQPGERAGTLACSIEIVSTLAEALDRAKTHGITREDVAERMGYHLGEKLSVATLNGYCAPSHSEREISLIRAMAFDAALGSDVLLGLFARKRGERAIVSGDDAALLEWARLHQAEKALGEKKRALEAVMKMKGRK